MSSVPPTIFDMIFFGTVAFFMVVVTVISVLAIRDIWRKPTTKEGKDNG